ncbi:globin domain-containing protein [Rhodococcus sp. HNM0569]|uniref:globin domain-containing protein n=1 Tax=Rhodococcus sp. HNM0569 TaxID=2716340 RepID=UPI00146DE95F|nr:globin domain-containing protein [Rhodococcus sp. HNM0569]NLU82311.1 hemin transporter [Rhodococcus sp. HNM0569]
MSALQPAASPYPQLSDRRRDALVASLPAVGANLDDITTRFYARMFEAHPELKRDVFNRANQAQGTQPKALAASIVAFATHLLDPSQPDPIAMMRRIAHKHASLGITADQYEIVHEHLFGAIVEVLGADALTADIVDAWQTVYWSMAHAFIGLEANLYSQAGVTPGAFFRTVTVVDRIDDPSGAATFVVEAPEGADPLPTFSPGQYISVRSELADGARQIRQYSLTGAPDTRWSFTVKRVADPGSPVGEVSAWLHETISAGSTLEVSLPYGDVVLEAGRDTPVVLVSAGIGITPMVGLLAYLSDVEPHRPTTVLHADRSAQSHPLREQVRMLTGRMSDVSVTTWYEEDALGDRTGRMDVSTLDLPAEADYFVCGSEGFVRKVRFDLIASGIAADRVHAELFTPDSWLATSDQLEPVGQ